MSVQDSTAQGQLQRAAWSSVVTNIVLTLGKGAIGLSTGSRALVADAVHSAADLIGSLAVIIGLRIARKPPDQEHPYGHGKAELISTAIVAVILMLASIDVAFTSVRALFRPPGNPAWTSAYAAAAAIFIKEWLFRYNYRLGKRLNSRSLLASAYDHRSDVFSSSAALVGILLSLVGKWLHVRALLYMDAVAAAFVAVLVFRMGYKLAYDTVQMLMDRVVELDDLSPYIGTILSVRGVEHIDEIRVRDHGQYVIVDVKISVDANLSVAEGHGIAADVKQELVEHFSRIQDVLIHVNPFYQDEQQGEHDG